MRKNYRFDMIVEVIVLNRYKLDAASHAIVIREL